MSPAHRIVCLSALLATLALGSAGTSHADESSSRILSFDSKVVISKNRDLSVTERIEISNNDGFFDGGLHRSLSIKRVTAQRKKPGSFESIHAKVDGQDANVTTEQSDIFQIGIPASANWSRGNHNIELSYVASNQFTDYGDYLDLNEDMTGEWRVEMDKATVELDFPDGVPRQLSISADTGTDAAFNFDCQRTELSSGMKFGTTHPLAPGQRLFISARFMDASYFAPAATGGIRGLLAHHPVLSPVMWVTAILLVLTVVAYFFAPKGSPGYTAAPNWIRVLLLASLPGTALLALRLMYEQTVMTWRDGEQMVGFALAHAYIFFYLPMLLSLVVAHFALASAIAVTFAHWLRKLPTPRWSWLAVGALAVSLVVVYIPYNVWMTNTVRIAGPGAHGSSFLMMAAADGKLPLAKILIAEGISPNTMGGGSTALDVACSSRNVDVARFLIEKGADLSHAPSCVDLSVTRSNSGSR